MLPPNAVLILHGSNVRVLDADLFVPGAPRTDYKRVYNVIPPSATEGQAVAIFLDGWRRAHETSGGSYDDAGHGALSDKTARLHGVTNMDAEFINWYARHYPGTKLIFDDMPQARREVEP